MIRTDSLQIHNEEIPCAADPFRNLLQFGSENRSLLEVLSGNFSNHEVSGLVTSLMESFLEDKSLSEDSLQKNMINLLIFIIYIRDCRGGCGMRDTFYYMFISVANTIPVVACTLLRFIPEFGYYKDFFQLIRHLPLANALPETAALLREEILQIVVQQLQEDDRLLNSQCNQDRDTSVDSDIAQRYFRRISLCAKYCPREGKYFAVVEKEMFRELIAKLFPSVSINTAKAEYRKMVVRLSQALEVTEQNFCAKKIQEIRLQSVPKNCLKRNARSFINSSLCEGESQGAQLAASVKVEMDSQVFNHPVDKEDGLQFPHGCSISSLCDLIAEDEQNLPIRIHEVIRAVLARDYHLRANRSRNLRNWMLANWYDRRANSESNVRKKQRAAAFSKKVPKDKPPLPELPSLQQLSEKDKLVNTPTYERLHSPVSENSLKIMWDSLRTKVSRSLRSHRDGSQLSLLNMVGILDVSGSMRGRPLEVGLALTMLASEVQKITGLQHQVLTFDTCPYWLSLAETLSLTQQAQKICDTGCSYHCDLQRCLQLIAQIAAKEKLTSSELPTLVFFSDREFDEHKQDIFSTTSGDAGIDKQLLKAKEYFTQLSLHLPRIVYWNLRGLHSTHSVTMGQYLSEPSGVPIDLFSGCLHEHLRTFCSGNYLVLPTATVPSLSSSIVRSEFTDCSLEREISEPTSSTSMVALSQESLLSHHHRSQKKLESFSWAVLSMSVRYASVRDALCQSMNDAYPNGSLRTQIQFALTTVNASQF